ncbi:hypothetical protein POM88_054084 [Heracleum sosnowskyi]|uniref:Uncharacterized protein n=1 Tax=Heracleum sosnowskyi TaxID=360622 RepID=A0AAD8GP33_9APIA|nr:hypothetical protein POM88_054084 [Heracleum sosnowskyi]
MKIEEGCLRDDFIERMLRMNAIISFSNVSAFAWVLTHVALDSDLLSILKLPLQEEKLTHVVEAERDSAQDLQPLPFHYVEIARLLFDHAHASSVLVLGIFIVAYKLDSPEMIQDAEIRPDDKY